MKEKKNPTFFLFLFSRLASIHPSKYADLDLITAVVHLK